jgi:two-component system response regulator
MDDNLPLILMADDSSDDTDFALDALAEFNLVNQVHVTRDGVEALDFMCRRGQFADRTGPDPTVLLLDINMPRLNGLEVLERMKNDPKLARIPVVMLTSSSASRDLTAARDLGAVAYIVKPVDYKSFSKAIKVIGQFWAILNILQPTPRG